MAKTTTKPRPYAQGTVVPLSRSLTQIETIIKNHGGEDIHVAKNERMIMIGFKLQGYPILIKHPLPDQNDYPQKRDRKKIDTKKFEAEIRRCGRVLHMLIKIRFDLLEIESVRVAFLPYIVTINGETIDEQLEPFFRHHLASGSIPPLLPG